MNHNTLYRGGLFLLLLHALFTSACSSASQQDIVFVNLGENTALHKKEGSVPAVYYNAQGQKFGLNNQLIISTDKNFNRANIQSISANIVKVQTLAELTDSNIHLLSFANNQWQTTFKKLQDHSHIRYVQPNLQQSIETTNQSSRDPLKNLAQLNEKQSADLMAVKKKYFSHHDANIRVAIIDDGFNLQHSEFSDLNITFAFDVDTKTLDASPKDQADYHGSLVMGIIAAKRDGLGVEGMAPNANIIPLRQATSWTSDIILSFTVARLMQADIINCSWTLRYLPQPIHDVINDIIESRQGKTQIVVAAGNRGKDACKDNPLSTIKGILTVGSLQADGSRAPFSNHGKCVDIYAPFGFTSTAKKEDGYRYFGGTSSSAAFVTGFLASPNPGLK